MFNRLIAFLLIFVCSATSLSNISAITGFELNQQYITKAFCVNKDKPQLHCNGQCYLRKKLKQAEEKEQKQSLKSQEQNLTVFAPFTFKSYFTEQVICYQVLNEEILPRTLCTIFHPPQFVVNI